MTAGLELPPAVRAFDALAPSFDERFGAWRSVAAQRRAVRRALLRAFPRGARVIELGGGTGDDALFLAAEGRRVLLTDGSPAMCARGEAKVRAASAETAVTVRHATLEGFDDFAARVAADSTVFDGAFSNFAALNCLEDLTPVARGLARLLRPRARVLLVMFGPFAPAEVLVELLRGRPHQSLRRLAGGPVPASVGGRSFHVFYPGPHRVARQFSPWFTRVATRGIGICVPPSAAEPWISKYPRLLSVLETADRVLTRPLAFLGDHVLVECVRTDRPLDAGDAR